MQVPDECEFQLFGSEWWVFFVQVEHYVQIKIEVLISMLRHAQAVKVHHRAPVRRKSSAAWAVTGLAGVRVGGVGMVALRLRCELGNKVSGVANHDVGSADLNLEPRGGEIRVIKFVCTIIPKLLNTG
ncbi:hypothetical protein ACFX13_022203 [Malus domestica]